MSKKPNLSAVKTAVHKEKFKHGSLAVVFTVVFIAVIIVINVLVSALTTRFPSMNFDLTKEGLNTLSDEATDVAKEIVNETTIYVIGSEVANLADRLHELNDKIKVEYIDPDMNPQFISDYAGDALTTGKVMVKTDKRHKTLAVTDLFSIQQDSSTGQYNYYSKVDGALANALYQFLEPKESYGVQRATTKCSPFPITFPRLPACSTTTTLKSKSSTC